MKDAETLLASFVRPPLVADLPPRVREAIARREWANELLARGIQFTVIIIFCFIYGISPKTSPQGAFSPVPYVLSAYLVLSVIGLVWGWLREPPDWAAYASILFDFALLYGLMVSFHIQYMQPASFILKAPALLYVFIFIAIRALRFDPRFVLVAGAVAATGWALLIFYVLRIDPGDNMLTRSYVEYLTSNSVLIGAEVDKILSILFVTGILALAVNGSSNLLVTAVAEQSAAADLSRFFDSSVAKGIRSSAAPLKAGEGEKRRATILSIDIRGFTRLAQKLDAPQVMQLLSAYHRRVVPIVQSLGGVIDKFMGDGVLATFGTSSDGAKLDDTPAANALRACEEILADHAMWWMNDQAFAGLPAFSIGLGVATGQVSHGAVGGGERLEMTVIGPPVNLAAKLEKHNKALGTNCLCDGPTWTDAKKQGYRGALVSTIVESSIEGLRKPLKIRVLRSKKV